MGYGDEGSSSRSPSGRVGERAVAFERTRPAQAYIMPSRPGGSAVVPECRPFPIQDERQARQMLDRP